MEPETMMQPMEKPTPEQLEQWKKKREDEMQKVMTQIKKIWVERPDITYGELSSLTGHTISFLVSAVFQIEREMKDQRTKR